MFSFVAIILESKSYIVKENPDRAKLQDTSKKNKRQPSILLVSVKFYNSWKEWSFDITNFLLRIQIKRLNLRRLSTATKRSCKQDDGLEVLKQAHLYIAK